MSIIVPSFNTLAGNMKMKSTKSQLSKSAVTHQGAHKIEWFLKQMVPTKSEKGIHLVMSIGLCKEIKKEQ